MSAFDIAHSCGELTDLLYALSKVVLVLLLDLELELSKEVIDLTVEVNLVPHVLEVLIGLDKVAVLLDELFHIGHGL